MENLKEPPTAKLVKMQQKIWKKKLWKEERSSSPLYIIYFFYSKNLLLGSWLHAYKGTGEWARVRRTTPS